MTVGDMIQLSAMCLLVIVTGIYAWRTYVISKAAKEQVEEIRLQRLAARPFVVPDIDIHYYQKSYINNMREIAQGIFPVIITNVGTESAIELEIVLELPIKGDSHNQSGTTREHMSEKLPLLLQGATWRDELSYVSGVDDEGEPIFSQPPPTGLYDLKVRFKSATYPRDSPLLEVTLPFELRFIKGVWWRIERHKLIHNLANS